MESMKRTWRSSSKAAKVVMVLAAMALVGTACNALNGDKTKTALRDGFKASQQAASTPTSKEPSPAPKSFAESELTKDSVTKASNLANVTDVEINDDASHPGKKIVLLHYMVDSTWNEESFVKDATRNMVRAYEALFANSSVSDVRLWADAKFTDQYGKENASTGVQMSWSRATADKIEWKTFKDMVLVDYKKAFAVSDAYNIHPAMVAKLKDANALPKSR